VIFIGLNKFHVFDSIKNKFAVSWNYLNSGISTITETEKETNVNSVFERIFLWRSAIKMGEENPVMGVGLSNWKIMWPKYGVSGANFLSSGVMHYEHPHNEFLLLYSETGILGLCLFLSIFIAVFLAAIKIFRKTENADDRKYILIFSTGIFSFLVISNFGYPFHRPFSAILLMLLIGLILKIGNKNVDVRISPINKAAIVVCFLLTIFHLRISAMRLEGEFYMQKALTEQTRGRFERMLKQIHLAENKYYQLDGTGTPLNWYKGFAHNYSDGDSMLYYFLKAEIQNPYHIQVISDIGAIYENSGNHKEAINYFNKAVSIFPRYYEGHFNLAIAYYNLNQPQKALIEINKESSVDPSYQRAMFAILQKNAEIYLQTLPKEKNTLRLQESIKDTGTLITYNMIALRNNVEFTQILRDSCLLNIEK
jgi:tetratricopeptide (TPR) repeat protein